MKLKHKEKRMKIGVISDIHGNIEALEAILKEFELQGVEKIIC